MDIELMTSFGTPNMLILYILRMYCEVMRGGTAHYKLVENKFDVR